MLEELRRAPLSLYSTYIFIYIPWGFAMNSFGIWAEVAKFNHWWQVFTCYGLYMIPISILLKKQIDCNAICLWPGSHGILGILR